jgi:hypothetical protein
MMLGKCPFVKGGYEWATAERMNAVRAMPIASAMRKGQLALIPL